MLPVSPPSLSLAGMTALVIGGSSGIGEAAAHGFAQAGARVAIAARRPDKLEAAHARLAELDGEARAYAADVTDRAELAKLAERAQADLGRIDILMNCQGTTVIKPTLELTPAEYDSVIATNLTSVFFACTTFGRLMVEQGSGAIINIASLAAHRGWPNACPYAISKHGVVGLTTSLAAEWAPHGVRVNAISPGFFMTELNRARMPQARKDAALMRTPAGRFGELGELVGAAIYLASPAASFVTGTILNVDGGYLASGI
ncbi:SDR family NAD(P)-dependent oxidoreductase [Enterovirga aerilata]|uniref:Glucose 1-dehydrogenase n=1 Tax=Enterovirga aerilata TaxID=2730920 RepID=A0A849IA05_9HYPH|nr:glucose 1-dehydrogenase [Enterovirga sp. DB1703]NNM72837.1 glucose 1-dehydrogenase [Enterovirga sp. DB1703]